MDFWKKLKNNPLNPNLAFDLLKQADQEVEKMEPIRILLAGKTGSGKSTLVNALFRENIASTGVGLPVTQKVQKISKEGLPLVIYDTKGLELHSKSQDESIQHLLHLVQGAKKGKVVEPIHLVYYCINATMARIEPQEIALISMLAQELPVIVVLTQAIGEDIKNFKNSVQNAVPQVKAIIPVLAKDFELAGGQKISAYGLEELINQSHKLVPKEVEKAFINAQRIDLALKVAQSRSWANKYMKTTFGIGLTPLPIADSALLVPIQITMLAHITSIFGLSIDKKQIVSMMAGVGGTGLASMVGKYLASSAAKWMPGVGSVTGGMVNGFTASTVTLALAYSYIEILKQITIAENQGKKLMPKEITAMMRKTFGQELETITHSLPDKVKDSLPEWIAKSLDQH
ncbi:YcjF family protein [Facklamia sp. 7083-14-GEN3]|uniref:YcjF family protein n=1 Tax=Facklamia sp. 7083-14-GEN3 TaxID=2973478 RepID=UPI00215BE0B8|nr:GTPase [Facklamia sp. 7083-14-GEN3]MCR8969976.1 50S ribosome-binding GTPase [Facklamia sp. 7083-14-GEN3]